MSVGRLLTLDEASERMRVSVRTLHRLTAMGHLRVLHIGRRALIPEREIEAYLAAAYRKSA